VRLIGIEAFGKDKVRDWEVVRGADGFRRVTLFETEEDDTGPSRVARATRRALERERPRVVVLAGWSSPEALSGLAWALRNSVPAILMADSTWQDWRRTRLREGVKRRVVSLYSTALVAGSKHLDYTAELGLPRDRIFLGYDVVDNEHFRSGAERARADAGLRARLGLPGRFFLACCRFIDVKNLPRLLEAYRRYHSLARDPWSLVLVGDGPLRAEVESTIRQLGLQTSVATPGFAQYDALPAYYGLAGAAVLASVSETWGLTVNEAMAAGLPVLVSRHCGCARDLVEEGRNGFTFDPCNVEQLSQSMLRLSSMSAAEREAMGRASQEIVNRWTPELFAENLEKAARAALAAPQRTASVLDRTLLWLLIHR
jgi:glycosyltransferase involved in cell wall biosynthesis